MYGRDAARVILQSCSLPIVQIMHTRVPGYVPAKLAGAVIHGRHLIENQNLRPGLLALLYGRIHRSLKKFCRDSPHRVARAPHAVHPAAPPGHRLLELGNTVPQLCYTLYT